MDGYLICQVALLSRATGVQADLLGTAWPVEHPYGSTAVLFPRAPLAPQLKEQAQLRPPDAPAEYIPLLEIDLPNGWGTLHGQSASVHAVTFVSVVPSADLEPLAVLDAAIPKWLSAATRWLAVLGHSLSVPEPPVPRPRGDLVGPAGIGHGSGEQGTVRRLSLDGRTRWVVAQIDPKPLDLADWAWAVSRANSVGRLPLQYQLLAAAQDGRSVGNSRSAVLDAAAAVEVALSSAIRERQPTTTDAEWKKFTRSIDGIMGLVDRAIEDGIDLGVSRNAVMGKIAGVRNDTAHAGHRPSRAELETCLDLAWSIVETLHSSSQQQSPTSADEGQPGEANR